MKGVVIFVFHLQWLFLTDRLRFSGLLFIFVETKFVVVFVCSIIADTRSSGTSKYRTWLCPASGSTNYDVLLLCIIMYYYAWGGDILLGKMNKGGGFEKIEISRGRGKSLTTALMRIYFSHH